MQEVILKARELALAIRDSDIYQRMQAAEKASEGNQDAAKAVADFMEKRSRVQELVGSTSDEDRTALAQAAAELDQAEQAMNAQPVIHEMQEARKDFNDMMESVNRVLQLIISGNPSEPGGCTGSCATCGGCHSKV